MAWKKLMQGSCVGWMLAGLSLGGFAATTYADAFELSNGTTNAFFQLPGITNPSPVSMSGTNNTSPGASQTGGGLYPGGAGLFYMDRNAGGAGREWIQDINNVNSQEPTSGAPAQPKGLNSWYWIGVGGNAAQPIDSLGFTNGSTTPIQQTSNYLWTEYGNSQVTVDMTTSLSQGTAYRSALQRTLIITNNTAAPLNVKFYGLVNLGLTQIASGGAWGNAWSNGWGGVPANVATVNKAVMDGTGTIVQTNSFAGSAPGMNISEARDTINTSIYYGNQGSPNAVQIANASTFESEFAGAVNGLGSSAAVTSNDPAFAFEYDLSLIAGGSVTITDNLSVVPEPTSVALLAVGGTLLGLCRRGRRQA